MIRKLVPDPFQLVLVCAVLVATLLPARGGFAVLTGWMSVITILLLFFFHGAKLKREEVVAGFVDWRLHLVILGCTFLMFPLLGFVAQFSFPHLLQPALWSGILLICALPSTVQSAIAFVSIARGNVPAAIAAASASQMLGILLTPALMGFLAGAHGAGTGLAGLGKIAAQILLPFLTGHLLRPWIGDWVERHRKLVGFTDRSTIVIAVYGAFSAAVIEGLWRMLSPGSLALLVLVNAMLLALALGGTVAAGRLFGFGLKDRVAILFCGTKKSLIQGVPMARIMFPGPQAGLILLPIMLFHQMQLMVCAFIAGRYAAKAEAQVGIGRV